jgi:hypothetical protein
MHILEKITMKPNLKIARKIKKGGLEEGKIRKSNVSWALVAHACNPSYLGS